VCWLQTAIDLCISCVLTTFNKDDDDGGDDDDQALPDDSREDLHFTVVLLPL